MAGGVTGLGAARAAAEASGVWHLRRSVDLWIVRHKVFA